MVDGCELAAIGRVVTALRAEPVFKHPYSESDRRDMIAYLFEMVDTNDSGVLDRTHLRFFARKEFPIANPLLKRMQSTLQRLGCLKMDSPRSMTQLPSGRRRNRNLLQFKLEKMKRN